MATAAIRPIPTASATNKTSTSSTTKTLEEQIGYGASTSKTTTPTPVPVASKPATTTASTTTDKTSGTSGTLESQIGYGGTAAGTVQSTPSSTITPVTDTLLTNGSRGDSVKSLQTALSNAGYDVGTIDGIYGSKTAAAVKAYQQAQGLSVDGIAGTQTLGALGLLKVQDTPSALSETAAQASTTTGDKTGKEQSGVSASLLTTGSQGTDVSQLQRTLIGEGYDLTVTGVYDTSTAAAVKLYQMDNKLSVDGVAGTQTLTSLGLKTQKTATSGSAGSTGSTGSAATSVANATSIGTTSGTTGTTTDTTGTTTSTVSTENAYADQLGTMTFSYDPQEDQEYLQAASTLENQIAQMMVGRGGLYSSVYQSMLSSKLIDLQMSMREEKYNEFKSERDFILSMAKYTSDVQAQAFNQDMTTKQYNLSLQREAFNEKMELASYNLQAQAQAFSQSQARASAAASNAAKIAAAKENEAAQQLTKQETVLKLNAEVVKAERAEYNSMWAQWKSDGIAKGDVNDYFNVPYGASYSNSTYAARILNKEAAIATKENEILEQADALNNDTVAVAMVKSMLS